MYGMSCDIAYKALQNLNQDLAYKIDENKFSPSCTIPDHWTHLVESKCPFSLSYVAFKEFSKLIYINKHINLFKNVLQLPMPKNIQVWRKSDLLKVHDYLNISSNDKCGKLLSLAMLRENLKTHLENNSSDKEKLVHFKSEGKSISELEFGYVKHVIWLNKNPKFWPPSALQMHNFFGRSVLAALLFSIPSSFPSVSNLSKFGYLCGGDALKFDLRPTIEKEKCPSLLLASNPK